MSLGPYADARTALYSEEAGFHHARFDRIPITVQRTPGFAKGLEYWNDRAGWELFTFTDSDPEISSGAISNCRSCALVTNPYANWKAPYVACTIDIIPRWRDLQTVAHELGHCLGLRHQPKGVMERAPAPRFDRRLLQEAGYADRSS
jgi:hypothetical protein